MLKSKAIAQTMDDEAKDQRKVRNKTAVFQEHQTLEEALAAGLLCTKCVATKQSTKGCKACMGKWFEEIRQSGAKSGPFRRVYSKSSGS